MALGVASLWFFVWDLSLSDDELDYEHLCFLARFWLGNEYYIFKWIRTEDQRCCISSNMFGELGGLHFRLHLNSCERSPCCVWKRKCFSHHPAAGEALYWAVLPYFHFHLEKTDLLFPFRNKAFMYVMMSLSQRHVRMVHAQQNSKLIWRIFA